MYSPRTKAPIQITDEQPLSHPEQYWVYAPICEGKYVNLEVAAITKDNWSHHYDSVLNLLRDGIETDVVQNGFVSVTFTDSVTLDITIVDYLLNLIMWSMLIRTNIPICSYHIFYDDESCTLTTINDFLWFDSDYIYELLGIEEEE